MNLTRQTHIRLARPSLDLAAAERFYVDGAGLQVLYRHHPQQDEEALLMLGLPGTGWHLELTRASVPLRPSPTPEDLLVLYLGQPAPDRTLRRLQAHGGVRVPALNPYWDTWGVTFADPDGYRLVLCQRLWLDS
ncbi:VOC family protein [Deinococcus hohokamensis]|uniref:VOC family protein n=1 Tax=Deinococcus hohokamensis TaxID=309883 RepID=A0ABV9IAN3_9DEIO